MNITEVRVRLLPTPSDRLRAFCSITFDNEFVVKDIKVIRGEKGVFVAMPSRKLADKCPHCNAKNPLRARFCTECGVKLPFRQVPADDEGRPKLHADIAHPISLKCRREVEDRILAAYRNESERSMQPGYKPVSIYSPDEMDVDERPNPPRAMPSPPPKDTPRREFGAGIL